MNAKLSYAAWLSAVSAVLSATAPDAVSLPANVPLTKWHANGMWPKKAAAKIVFLSKYPSNAPLVWGAAGIGKSA